jgi:phosphoacetylglucosamine mutase
MSSSSPTKAAHDHAALLSSLEKAADAHPKPENVTFSYGTAGFRTL